MNRIDTLRSEDKTLSSGLTLVVMSIEERALLLYLERYNSCVPNIFSNFTAFINSGGRRK